MNDLGEEKKLLCKQENRKQKTMDDIPVRLRDSTTFLPNHTVWAHFVCVAIRCLVALYFWKVYEPDRDRLAVTILCIAILFVFTYKYVFVKSWKVFARVVFVYSMVLSVLYTLSTEQAKTIAGLLVVMDAMMGLQSRYTATLMP